MNLLDAVKGVFPKTKKGLEDDHEELRCLYVALTRAKNRLYICLPKTIIINKKRVYSEISHHLAYLDVIDCCDCNGNVYDLFPGEFMDEEDNEELSWDFR